MVPCRLLRGILSRLPHLLYVMTSSRACISFLGTKMSLKNLSYICSRCARWAKPVRRDARVDDWGGLENRCPGNRTGGSNPSLSAIKGVNQIVK